MKKFISIIVTALAIAIVISGVLWSILGQSNRSTFFAVDNNQASPLNNQNMLDKISSPVYRTVEGIELASGSTISFIGTGGDDVFWQAVYQGALQAGKEINEMLGYGRSEKVEIVFLTPNRPYNIDDQVNILDEELARFPDAIVIAPMDADGYAMLFDHAIELSIPLIAIGADSHHHAIQSTVKSDGQAEGETLGLQLISYLQPGDGILYLSSSSLEHPNSSRKQAITRELTKAQLFPLVHELALDNLPQSGTLGEEEGNARPLSEREFLMEYFTLNPHLQTIVGLDNEATLLAVEVAGQLGNADGEMLAEKMTIMGFDADGRALAALADGSVHGLIESHPFAMGYAAVVAAARAIMESGNEAQISIGYVWTDGNIME